jgi:hypothetical protein
MIAPAGEFGISSELPKVEYAMEGVWIWICKGFREIQPQKGVVGW